ncbi:arylamine N-acetyltransferase family protein [Microbacterium sp.]|uniref:arylamine N-acetyltransferase family protein n=1 Tax=Microbacterium sp. TaxID=51671 RepID=UPI003A85EF03
MTPDLVERYLERLGMPRPRHPLTPADVAALARAHGARIPFENLRLHPDGALVLDEALIVRRILDDGEGGLCYELNSAFGLLLTALGAEVTLLGATVEITTGDLPGRSIPLSHMALQVRMPGAVQHVDVGFGGSVIVRREATDSERVTADPGRSYIVDGTARRLSEFADAAHWHSSSPESRFQRSVVCSLALPDGNVTLSAVPAMPTGTGLQWRFTEHGAQRPVTTDEAQRLLRTRFGMTRPLPTALHRGE